MQHSQWVSFPDSQGGSVIGTPLTQSILIITKKIWALLSCNWGGQRKKQSKYSIIQNKNKNVIGKKF